MDSTAASSKVEVASSQPENEIPVCEISQPDEKQSTLTVSEQKVDSSEQPPDVVSQAQQASLPAKAEEKAKQPVVLNPVPHQQVQQPQENKPASTADGNTNMGKDSASVDAELKTGHDLILEMGLMEPQSVSEESGSQTATNSSTQSDRTETAHSPVSMLQSVIPPTGATKKRFTVRKVEDRILNIAPTSESKLGNNEPEPPAVNTRSNTDKKPENEHIPGKPESELQQELSDDAAVLHTNLEREEQVCLAQQVAGDTSSSKQNCDTEKSDIGQSSSTLHEGEQLEINFEVQASKAGVNCLQVIRTSSTYRPPTPTYAFRPVDNSSSEDHALPRNTVKFESQISGEELYPGKPKVESVLSSDDELPASAPTEKEGVSSSVSEFVQGRFIVSASSDRPDTPSSETSDQAKHPLQPLEITLQDVKTAAGMGSNPSLTPSSSMESLNSVGSQPGLQYVHAFSSSPQTILPEGQSSSNLVAGSHKDQVRKNSGPSDLPSDISRQSFGKQEADQVGILHLLLCLTPGCLL